MCTFFPVMFPYLQKYCLFTAPISFMCLCKAQQHLNQASDCQAGHSVKRKWKTCSQIPEVWPTCLWGTQLYFCDSFSEIVFYPHFLNEESRKRSLRAWICKDDSMCCFSVLIHLFKFAASDVKIGFLPSILYFVSFYNIRVTTLVISYWVWLGVGSISLGSNLYLLLSLCR